ncbi:hypothetical protein LPK64_29105 [Klebsiella pneumoniae]|nr:hypothetical protein [Klebsiella pneumoniae]
MNAKVMKIRPDSKLAETRNAEQRAQVLRNIDTADDLMGTALVEAVKMTVTLGATSKDEVREHWPRCNHPDVYASYFNRGHKVQAIIGQARTLELIEQALKGTGGGSAFFKVLDALKAVMSRAKESGQKTMAGREAQRAVREAVEKANAPKEKKAKGARGQNGATEQRATVAATVAAALTPADIAAAARLLSQHAHRIAAPEGREDAWRKAQAALASAAEALAPFIRKAK